MHLKRILNTFFALKLKFFQLSSIFAQRLVIIIITSLCIKFFDSYNFMHLVFKQNAE